MEEGCMLAGDWMVKRGSKGKGRRKTKKMCGEKGYQWHILHKKEQKYDFSL
jgi:hypothetical protein